MPNPKYQHNVDLFQTGRNLDACDPAPVQTELWNCPNCQRSHKAKPINPPTYKCICGWYGDKLALILSLLPGDNHVRPSI